MSIRHFILIITFLVSAIKAFQQEKLISFPLYSSVKVRSALINKEEIALIDIREEFQFAKEHPLFAANIPLSFINSEAIKKIPRLNTPVVIYGNNENHAKEGARQFAILGYSNVRILEAGLEGWKASGGITFRNLNAPSKAFGELVEAKHQTPMLSAEEVKKFIDSNENIVILDARKYEEYHNMNIPGSISVPGAELVLRARALAPDTSTTIIVNCAGRTRSIIGTQSLVNAGIPNRVIALRNGTMGWTLAGFPLEHGSSRVFPAQVENKYVNDAAESSRKIADRAGVKRIGLEDALERTRNPSRTFYLLDIRDPHEYIDGHIQHFKSAPGGQLVQETDHWCPVRGASIILADDTAGVRANMTASWLAQMGWEVYVLNEGFENLPKEKIIKGPDPLALLPRPEATRYKRPYDGVDDPVKAMEDYLQWEHGLVKQLEEDGTHHFFVLD